MMKKALFAVLIGLVLGIGPTLFAQEKSQRKESEFYYFSVPIEKIYSYRSGYVVTYRKGINKMTRTYIPHSWFEGPNGKAEEIGLGSGKAWPSLTVYYKNGEFSHVRLYVRRERSHESWGIVPLNVNIDQYFEGVEEIKLEF
ncbi:hypothetical protein [Leadbettera azotonutricia]|uniref:Uncharacterized protein n=1 Tax=Leadbettera azotonutricia (strain ATCC BAA-888 / DSM 13862 / ZAS-9) TaxID=545695 RepID=F5YAD4_LEAAZ|nr:hypothetical protein [Leadbettera azotonutricia]AEF80336.1 conserved hypothetical protein [Leadbettera azotonutricia ZAS-9]